MEEIRWMRSTSALATPTRMMHNDASTARVARQDPKRTMSSLAAVDLLFRTEMQPGHRKHFADQLVFAGRWLNAGDWRPADHPLRLHFNEPGGRDGWGLAIYRTH